MSLTLNELLKKLNISAVPQYFYDFYDEVMADYDKNGLECISEAYLKYLKDEYDIFPTHYDLLQETAAKIRENDALARYAALLRKTLEDRSHVKDLSGFEYPKTDVEDDQVPYRMVSIYASLSRVDGSVKYLREHNVPEDIIIESMRHFEACIDIYKGKWGYHGYNETYFAWGQHYVDCDIMRIGCLNFEIAQSFKGDVRGFKNGNKYMLLADDIDVHKNGQRLGSIGCEDTDGSFHADIIETDEYYEGYPIDTANAAVLSEKIKLPKSEWSVAIQKGDQFISVHIPRGENISYERTQASYKRCLEVYTKCFPDFKPKAFACYSWMMEPKLMNMLKPESKIAVFQSKFMRFPAVSNGRGVFNFLFPDQSIKRLEDLPENTSLERNAKKYLLEGNHLYEQGGIFFEI